MLAILLFSIPLAWFPSACGKLQAICSSEMTVMNDQNRTAVINITGRLSNDSNLQRSCVLKLDKPGSFLRVKAKRNDNYKGFLHVFLYEAGGSSLLGHLDVSQPAPVWNSLNLSPSGSTNGKTSGEKSLSIVGTGKLSFTVQIAQGLSEIALDQPQTVHVKRDEVTIFQFIAPQGISSKQLDITATSRESNAAYLKVSQTFEDIQENIEVVDYKKESLRLSFAKKGRITLSKVSVPPLTDSVSRWFIGIKLKNASGDVKFSESKHVTLKLTRSFDYDYATPICTLFFVSFLGGLSVSIIALALFKECLLVQNESSTTVNKSGATGNESSTTVNKPGATGNESNTTVNKPGATGNESSTTVNKPGATGSDPGATVIANKNIIEGEPVQNFTIDQGNNQNNNNCWKCNSISKCCKKIWENCPMLQVAYYYWFSSGPKTYSYITGIVGSVLMVGAFQFVFANWYTMIQEGDRDNCYYNDFCYRVSHYHDIPLNLMISNLTYIIHGLILFFCVWWLETKLYLYCESNISSQVEPQGSLPDHAIRCPNITLHLLEKGKQDDKIKSEKEKLIAKAKKKKYSHSIGYAFSWALIFEGLFSTLYHFCPSRFTFQFDSAFMFIISGLTVLLLYNGIEQNQCPYLENVKYPVGATNFFFFFIVPLFIFNYFGSLYNSESGMGKVLQGCFFACLLTWWLSMVLWAFYKLNLYEQIFQKSSEANRYQKGFENYCNAFLFFVGGLGVPPLLFGIWLNDISQVFLFSCIVGSVVAVLAKTTVKPLKQCCKKGSANTGSGQTGSGQTGSAETGSTQTGSGQTGLGQTGLGQTGSGQTGSGQTGLGQTGSGQTGSGQSSSGQTGSVQTGSGQTGSAQTGSGQTGSGQTGSGQTGSAQTGSAQTGSGQTSSGQTGSAQTGSAQTGSQQTGSGQTGSAQTRSADTGSGQTGSAQTCSADTGSADTAGRWWLIGFQAFYIVVTVGLLVAAVAIFTAMPTTDKTSTPENSRDENKECFLFGFFDWHDLWHFLSSFALLMGAFVVMFVSAEPVSSRRKQNPTEQNEVIMNKNVVPGGEQQEGDPSEIEMGGAGMRGGRDGDNAGK